MECAVTRFATRADICDIERIENESDAMLIQFLRPARWQPAPSGESRAAMPGFILVAAPGLLAPAVGFAHVIEIDGLAHLEQLSVLPSHGRRGHGRTLVQIAKDEAGARGYREITLRTFADVPWNAPFYARFGFFESEPGTPFHRELVRRETELGLDCHGKRIQMTATLPAPFG